jgi:hypothetical protein
MPQTCILCGCSDSHPCLGVAAPDTASTLFRRQISDEALLAPGQTCHWAVETNLGPVCSAHTLAEAERLAGIIDPDEAIWGGT